jgi:type IV pilus assembly protein PilE
MPTAPHTADRSPARRGFTLTELMVVTVIIGVLAAMSVPSFRKAVEQSRADIAVANLRAIWAAERLYWLEYHTYTPTPGTALQGLNELGLIDKEVVSGTGGYTYAVTSATATTFTATATNINGLGSFSIKEAGELSGSVELGTFKIESGLQWTSAP